MANELRQAINKVTLVGVVKEVKGNGKDKPFEVSKNENGEKYISGKMVLKTGEFSEVTLNVYVKELNKKGEVKKNFKILKDIIDGRLKTVATAKEGEEPVVLSIFGNGDFVPHFSENRYVTKETNEVKVSLQADLGFGNLSIKEDLGVEDFKAEFDVEMFVTSIEDEMRKVGEDDEEETGRLIVKGYTPVYDGDVIKTQIVVPETIEGDEEEVIPFAEQVREAVEEGNTVEFYGDMNYQRIVKEKKVGGKLGKAKIEKEVTTIYELVAGGAEIIEGDNEYDEDDIEKAVKERQIKLEEILNNTQSEDEKPKGLGVKKDNKDKPKRKINF